MNTEESVKWLAQVHSGKCYPKRFDEINKELPYFHIFKDALGKYDIACFNYKGHDNEDRMPYMAGYFKQVIFPYVTTNISGYYNIELHDGYTYLKNGKDYKDCLTFAKFKTDKLIPLLPDVYFINNWGDQVIKDPTPWEDKLSKICWFGTTTGSRIPTENNRIKTCLWALNKRDICDFYVTKVAQMDPAKVLLDIPEFKQIYRQGASQEEQMKYRYHLTLDGNTSGWNVWEYKTNSLVFKQKSNEMLWYYPLMKDKVHFVNVDTDNMESMYQYYQNKAKEANLIIKNANQFASESGKFL